MNRIFNLDSPVMVILSRVADLVILNLTWLVFCLPVVTIGASTTALYRVTLDLLDDRGSSVLRGFWDAFRANFKKATLLFLILLVPLALVVLDLWFLLSGAMPASVLSSVLCILPAVVFVFVASYVYPLTAQFENTLGGTLKNAFFMSFAHLPVTLVVSLLNLLPVILFFFWPTGFWYSLIVWFLLGGSLVAYTNTLLLRKVFRRYFPKEDAPEEK
jgi:uncharacterized membrane protein YesL